MIIRQLQLGTEGVFCYLLACEESRKAVIIDPGGDENELLAIIEDLQVKPLFIINTHCHPDHTCGNAIIKNATGALIIRHMADEELLQDPDAREFFNRQGFPPSLAADRLVQDGDRLVFGNYTLRILHTPGHSPGSICVYVAGNLFTGDSLFVGAAGRVDVPGGDFTTLINSLTDKLAVLPDDTVVWPGHDYGDTPTSSIGREKKENPYIGGEW